MHVSDPVTLRVDLGIDPYGDVQTPLPVVGADALGGPQIRDPIRAYHDVQMSPPAAGAGVCPQSTQPDVPRGGRRFYFLSGI